MKLAFAGWEINRNLGLSNIALVNAGVMTIDQIVEALEALRDIGWSTLCGEQLHGEAPPLTSLTRRQQACGYVSRLIPS